MGSKEETTSTLIGVAICITGNCCISLALNLQKKAHISLQSAGFDSELDPDGLPGVTTHSRRPSIARSELSLLLPQNSNNLAPTNYFGSVRSVSESILEEGGANSSSGGGGKKSGGTRRRPLLRRKSSIKPRTDKLYLKSKLWWTGLALLNLGELGNFVAYAFSPASLVAPLGTVALVANCFLAPLILKEPFRKQDLIGIALAVSGGVTVVWSSKPSDKKLYPDEMLHAISAIPFILYAILSLIAGSVLTYFSRTKWGDKFVMIDIGICAVAGGFTVLSTKALSSFLSLIFLDTFKYIVTYPILAVLIGTALIQVNFINKSLQRFESRIVIPCQFCSFSFSAILGSAILYRDFDDVEFDKALNFGFGLAMSGFGVWVLTRPTTLSLPPSPVEDPALLHQATLPPSTPRLRKRLSMLSATERPALNLRARTLSVTLGASQYLLVAQSPSAGGGAGWVERERERGRESESEGEEGLGDLREDNEISWEANGLGRERNGNGVSSAEREG